MIEASMADVVKLWSAIIHAEEYMETREPADRLAFEGVLADPRMGEMRAALQDAALLPVKR